MECVKKNTIVCGHNPCLTQDAQYLCLTDIYEKFQRANFYDIGGTYTQDVADYWFMFRTEQVGQVYLLHLFVLNRQEGYMDICISSFNKISLDKVTSDAVLSPTMTRYKFGKLKESSLNYLTTYSFEELDVDLLKDKKLLIPVSFKDESHNVIKSDIKECLDLSALLEDPIGSDFTIESQDGAKFEVHKLLLTSHSDVFRAMLKDDTAESNNNYVKLIGVYKIELQHILEFIYTGTILHVENINFFSMLILADRFNLQGLKELSEHALELQLSLDNATETLAVADSCNSQFLKMESLKFIKKHYKNNIDNSLFDELNNIELIRELCRYLAK